MICRFLLLVHFIAIFCDCELIGFQKLSEFAQTARYGPLNEKSKDVEMTTIWGEINEYPFLCMDSSAGLFYTFDTFNARILGNEIKTGKNSTNYDFSSCFEDFEMRRDSFLCSPLEDSIWGSYHFVTKNGSEFGSALFRVDKKTGKCEKIIKKLLAEVDVGSDMMVINPDTKKVYMECKMDSALLEIDMETKDQKIVMDSQNIFCSSYVFHPTRKTIVAKCRYKDKSGQYYQQSVWSFDGAKYSKISDIDIKSFTEQQPFVWVGETPNIFNFAEDKVYFDLTFQDPIQGYKDWLFYVDVKTGKILQEQSNMGDIYSMFFFWNH